jgi:hypothetical protein
MHASAESALGQKIFKKKAPVPASFGGFKGGRRGYSSATVGGSANDTIPCP